MFGDYDQSVKRQLVFFEQHNVKGNPRAIAVDLGSGSGFQSVALKKLGYDVYAVDLSEELLSELREKDSSIHTRCADICDLSFAKQLKPELIVCMGDTLTHLPDLSAVLKLIEDSVQALKSDGKLILTFRNLSSIPKETDRFFIVRSDENQILTCFLEDEGQKVKVTDLLHKRHDQKWTLEKSSYLKLRIDPEMIEKQMSEFGFRVSVSKLPSGLDVVIGQK
jgi:SAM-dependent methyltransferase